MAELLNGAAPALDEAFDKDGGDDWEGEGDAPATTYAKAVVSLEAGGSYFRSKEYCG